MVSKNPKYEYRISNLAKIVITDSAKLTKYGWIEFSYSY